MSDPQLIEAAIREAVKKTHEYYYDEDGSFFLDKAGIDLIVKDVLKNYKRAEKKEKQ